MEPVKRLIKGSVSTLPFMNSLGIVCKNRAKVDAYESYIGQKQVKKERTSRSLLFSSSSLAIFDFRLGLSLGYIRRLEM